MANDWKFAPLIFSFVLSLLVSCAQQTDQARRSPAAPEQRSKTTYVYRCEDGFEFVVNLKEKTAWLFLPGQTVNAPRTPSGSGEKYQKEGITYWNKEEEALISIGSNVHKNCKNDHRAAVWEDAKLRGIDFRAVGNEPGWHLEISHHGITHVRDYGNTTQNFPLPSAQTDQLNRRTVYQTENEDATLVLQLEGKICSDSMSDEQFETSVTVYLDGNIYQGCGRALH